MARASRPPGFDMTYRPTESVFGPPWFTYVPSTAYLLVSFGVVGFVWFGEQSAAGTFAYKYVVEQDLGRPMSIRTLSVFLVISAVAAVLRAAMRGVRIYGDGVEIRDVLNGIVPKIRRYRWAQIDRVVLDLESSVALDLWDSSRVYLPPVSDRETLSLTLEKVAAARAIPVRGGRGIDEIPDPEGDEDDEAA